MTGTTVEVAALTRGAHACAMFDNEFEQEALLTDFVRNGLRSGCKVLCVADARSTRRILEAQLAGALAATALDRGQLVIKPSDEAYVAGARFDLDRMLAMLRAEVERATVGEGWPALHITGDVTWTLRPLPGVDQLIEYERRVSRVLAGTSGLALCQYDRRRLPDDVVAGGLETHRHTVPTGHAPEAPFRVLPQGPGRFRLVGELDLVDADVMAETLDVALAGGADRLVIDLRDLSFVDVAGLSAMCGPATEGRADVVLRHPRPVVRRMLGLLDLDRLACVRIDDGRGW